MQLTTFEVNKHFPAPFPINESSIMELWGSGLVVIIQMPNLTKEKLKTLKKALTHTAILKVKRPFQYQFGGLIFPNLIE